MSDEERSGGAANFPDDLRLDDHPTEWGVAAAHAFRAGDQVRHDSPVVDPEFSAGAPETGHHLVGDEEHVVRIADATDFLEVAGGGRLGTERRADYRLS